MTCAPCFAACSMLFTWLAIIESLSPVQAAWTSAAFTVVISPSPFEPSFGRDASGEHNAGGRHRSLAGPREVTHETSVYRFRRRRAHRGCLRPATDRYGDLAGAKRGRIRERGADY